MTKRIKCNACDLYKVTVGQLSKYKCEKCDKTGVMDSTIDNLFCTHKNGMQKCDVCDLPIPKDVKRVSFESVIFESKVKFRMCSSCLKKAYDKIDHVATKKWEKELMIKRL